MATPQLTNPDTPLFIYGSGDQGLVVADAATQLGYKSISFIDDSPSNSPTNSLWPTLPKSHLTSNSNAIVAIGNNNIRHNIINSLLAKNINLITIIHPAASVSPLAQIEPAVFIAAGAIVNPLSHIAIGSIINSNATIEHHNTINTCAHIAPGATLCGRVTIGNHALIGANATILPCITIGSNTIIAAGAVVTHNIPDNKTAKGIPAKTD